MDLRNADLNLLLPLRALLDARSVSKAAVQLGVSQPTMSGLLQRLRRHFGDELLVRQGNSYELTPLAHRLQDMSAQAQWSISRLFAAQSDFDPATSTRGYRIHASDYMIAVTGSALSALLRVEAPHMSIHFSTLTSRLAERGTEALRQVDGALLPYGIIADSTHLELTRDRWVCIAWEGNSAIGDALTIENLSSLPWVYSFASGNAYNPALRQMEVLGIEARVELEMPSFLALPSAIVGTPRLAFMQASLASTFATGFGLRILEPPFEVHPLRQGFWWHPSVESEPEHVWLRELLARTAAASA